MNVHIYYVCICVCIGIAFKNEHIFTYQYLYFDYIVSHVRIEKKNSSNKKKNLKRYIQNVKSNFNKEILSAAKTEWEFFNFEIYKFTVKFSKFRAKKVKNKGRIQKRP